MMTLTIPLTRDVTNTSAFLDLGLTSLILESSILRDFQVNFCSFHFSKRHIFFCFLNSASYCLSLGSFLVHVCLLLSIPYSFILPFSRVNGVLSHNSNFTEHTEELVQSIFTHLKTFFCYEKAYLIHFKKIQQATLKVSILVHCNI